MDFNKFSPIRVFKAKHSKCMASSSNHFSLEFMNQIIKQKWSVPILFNSGTNFKFALISTCQCNEKYLKEMSCEYAV